MFDRMSVVAEQASSAREAAGDEARLARDLRLRSMVEQFHTTVWRALRRLGVAYADAEDVAQEVFVSASNRLAQIEMGKERAFLMAVAVHHAAHAHRSRLRRREVVGAPLPDAPHPAPGPDDLADRARARELLYRLLDELSFEQRAVFVLYEIEQMTMAEIAASLELPSGTVASRLRKAREHFLELARRSTEIEELRGETP
jgi:RNA polymerase sigma-70 factor (ECF subfamily)